MIVGWISTSWYTAYTEYDAGSNTSELGNSTRHVTGCASNTYAMKEPTASVTRRRYDAYASLLNRL